MEYDKIQFKNVQNGIMINTVQNLEYDKNSSKMFKMVYDKYSSNMEYDKYSSKLLKMVSDKIQFKNGNMIKYSSKREYGKYSSNLEYDKKQFKNVQKMEYDKIQFKNDYDKYSSKMEYDKIQFKNVQKWNMVNTVQNLEYDKNSSKMLKMVSDKIQFKKVYDKIQFKNGYDNTVQTWNMIKQFKMSRLQTYITKKAIKYRPFLSVKTPVKELIAFGGSVEYRPSSSATVDLTLDKVVDKPVKIFGKFKFES
ncbi:hypothetical protein KUTeg_015130 [Tegillarca granosa]|uniref:Uncharacterized protein n=1 Tax=Tegillarca granosa TaxID=220873 RepID=A0ABQ9ESV8_TEGGR|nr:hypothetical protein KUTeg_015130 [Tegillarca granosa]